MALTAKDREYIAEVIAAAFVASKGIGTPARDAEAQAHFAAQDITVPCCGRTFKTAAGQAWHAANFKHTKA